MTRAVQPIYYYLFLSVLVLLQFSSCVYEPVDPDLNLVDPGSQNLILKLELTKGSYSNIMAINGDVVSGTVDESISLSSDIVLHVEISEEATISPNPATITSISGPFNLVVTSSTGDSRMYVVDITVEEPSGPSDDNFITSFNIVTPEFTATAAIDDLTGLITQRVPASLNVSNLSVSGTISNNATISRPISSVSDFSSIVSYTVTSETGIVKTYRVEITQMDTIFSVTCDEGSVSKWFGGYDFVSSASSSPFDRNVGTGQYIQLDQDTAPTRFSIYLEGGFRYYDANTFYNAPIDIRLIVRDSDEQALGEITTTVDGSYRGGAIDFDLSNSGLLLEANERYAFQWFVVNGAIQGVMTSSLANNARVSTGFCFQGGISGQSMISRDTFLEEADIWVGHPWNFNIGFEGIQ
jgi:hypothetical protein